MNNDRQYHRKGLMITRDYGLRLRKVLPTREGKVKTLTHSGFWNSHFLYQWLLLPATFLLVPHFPNPNVSQYCAFLPSFAITLWVKISVSFPSWTPLMRPNLQFIHLRETTGIPAFFLEEFSSPSQGQGLFRTIFMDQFKFLGNFPPTPPLTQHFALSEK